MFPRPLIIPRLRRTTTSQFSPLKLTTIPLCTIRRVPAMETTSPWHAAYPAPRNAQPDTMTPAQVLDLLRHRASDDTKSLDNKVILVDLRRNDHQGGAIRGSINLPAQSLYPAIPQLYELFRAAGVQTVIWFCASSKGRGPRAAGWFHDHIQDLQNSEMKSVVLSGGIKGWVASGDQFISFMDGYDAANWE